MSMKVENVTIDFGDTLAKKWAGESEARIIEGDRNERMWELYKGYLQCKTYAGKQAYILEHAIINKGKFFSMSKRRQKVFLDNAFGTYCHVMLDKLVPRSRRNQRWIVQINPVMKFVEQTGKPFNDFMDGWVQSLMG